MVLQELKCEPCQKGTPPLTGEETEQLLCDVPDWELKDERLERQFKFRDFIEALDFVVRVGEVAEEEGHHPDIHVSYNRVRLTLTTHKIGGLSRNDFILAAKVDRLV